MNTVSHLRNCIVSNDVPVGEEKENTVLRVFHDIAFENIII